MKTNACEAASIYAKAAKLAWPSAPKKARDIIAQWYANEGAAEDFDSAKDLADFMKDDIEAMLDAATDPDEIEAVCAATGCEGPSSVEAGESPSKPDERDAADAIIEYLGKSFKRIDPVGSDKLRLTIAGNVDRKLGKMKKIAAQYGCLVKPFKGGVLVVQGPKSEGFRLELVGTITVPQWLYDAYVMGNEYGGDLTATEQEKLSDFREKYRQYHLDNHDEEAQYCGTNDFDGMGGLCYDVDVYRRSSDEKCEGQEADLSIYLDDVANSLEWDFEYSPVTAFEFAHDDYKDIAIACFGENKSPKEAATVIDSKFTDGDEAKGETMDFEKYYKEFEKEAKKLLSAELWDKAAAESDPREFAQELLSAEFEAEEAAEEYAEMVQTMEEQGYFGESVEEPWSVEFKDIWDNQQTETFETEAEAWARYNELSARTTGDMSDIMWVKEPACAACECGSSAASLGAVPNGGSQVKDEEAKYCINCGEVCGEGSEHHGPYDFCSQACYLDFIEHEEIPEGKKAEGEGKDEFLKDALYHINFDGDEEVVAKLVKDGEDFSLVALMPDGKAKAVMTADLFSVVDYCKELLDMDAEDAIIIIENA